MTKLRYLIVDDEPLAHKVIIEFAKDVVFLELVGQTYSATKALEFLKENEVDLIFLDIQMPKLTGLEMLNIAQVDCQVIITSAYKEYALDGYKYDVCDYLLKPFRLDRFILAAEKALEKYLLKNAELQTSRESILIKVDKKIIPTQIGSIIYLESYGNYVKVHTKDAILLTPNTLSNFENLLPKDQFFKIHKSYIINKKQIKYIENAQLTIVNEKQLPISKHLKKEFLEFMCS
jgi:DNA-binding LytR/AlgR family response regulator